MKFLFDSYMKIIKKIYGKAYISNSYMFAARPWVGIFIAILSFLIFIAVTIFGIERIEFSITNLSLGILVWLLMELSIYIVSLFHYFISTPVLSFLLNYIRWTKTDFKLKLIKKNKKNKMNKNIQVLKALEFRDDIHTKKLYALIASEMMYYIVNKIAVKDIKTGQLIFFTQTMFVFEEIACSLEWAELLKIVTEWGVIYTPTDKSLSMSYFDIALERFSSSKMDSMLLAFTAYLLHEGIITSSRKTFDINNDLVDIFKILCHLNFVIEENNTFKWTDKMSRYFQDMYEWDENKKSIMDKIKK